MPLNTILKGIAFIKVYSLLAIMLLFSVVSYTQNRDTTNEVQLTEVRVKAFERSRRLQDVPASVSHVGRAALERFNTTSIVNAINTQPGVRMEERSPGSYRFNIRGSSLRSPFGVRNIKVYFNDIPFTDPGGHTYLNQLGYYNFSSVDIIKGPGNSLYGAGTGGVLLINSLNTTEQPGLFGEYAIGSYSMQNTYAAFTTGTGRWMSKTGYQHQESNGYRQHSSLRRDVLSWSSSFRFDSIRQLRASFLYGDLEYETPGALTLAEYQANPRQARPGNAFFPGAEQARAAVRQRTFLAGVSYTQLLTRAIQSKTVLYGAFTQLRNPTIQNYGRSSEPHVGGRSVFTWTHPLSTGTFTLDAGAEWQQGFTTYTIHDNKGGQPDTLRIYNEVNNRQSFVFAQASLELEKWLFTAGLSSNQRHVNFRVFEPTVIPQRTKKFDNELTPRVALLKKWNRLTAYTSISKGFSPPTTEEIFPTGGDINLELNAEDGTNYDVGIRGQYRGLSFDINAFYFALKNTIVQRRTAGGGSYFINAGKTNQKGLETQVNYALFQQSSFFGSSLIWLSHTWHNFQYKAFKQVDTDYSNNQLPGVAPHSIASGIDLRMHNGLLTTITYYYNARTPVNDANAAYANAFHIIGAKVGYQKWYNEKWRLKLIAGVENLFDERYSLGNDINGFGGRYYNAAPGRNYYASLIFQWLR